MQGNQPSAAPRRVDTNEDLCRDCQACALACSLLHDGQCHLGLARLQVAKDMARYAFTIRVCQHCVAPACLAACASGAMCLDQRGIVLIDEDLCTRCGACAESCPYEAVFYNEATDRYLKCDLCGEREGGPLCVEVCPVDALTTKPLERAR